MRHCYIDQAVDKNDFSQDLSSLFECNWQEKTSQWHMYENDTNTKVDHSK